MPESIESKPFDIEAFKRELIPVRDDFGTNNYIAWETGASAEANEAKRIRAAELYEQLLDMCAEALLAAANKKEVEMSIHREIVWHKYGNGFEMIGGSSKTEFWERLAMRIAQKATENKVALKFAKPLHDTEQDDPNDPLRWQSILDAHPDAKEGMFNPDRKALLCVGAHILLSGERAESWIPELRVRGEIARKAAIAQEQPIPESKPVRVTIVEIPESTVRDPVDGKITVEAAGVRAEMSASIFYNCIKGPDTGHGYLMSEVSVIGRNDSGVG